MARKSCIYALREREVWYTQHTAYTYLLLVPENKKKTLCIVIEYMLNVLYCIQTHVIAGADDDDDEAVMWTKWIPQSRTSESILGVYVILCNARQNVQRCSSVFSLSVVHLQLYALDEALIIALHLVPAKSCREFRGIRLISWDIFKDCFSIG